MLIPDITKLVEQDQFPGLQRIAEARSNFWSWARAVSESRVPRTGTPFQWLPLRPAWAIPCSLILVGITWIWFRTASTCSRSIARALDKNVTPRTDSRQRLPVFGTHHVNGVHRRGAQFFERTAADFKSCFFEPQQEYLDILGMPAVS